MNKLFVVYIGGKISGTNIESHDIRFLIGETVHDTYEQIRKEWVGDLIGLHIDSYLKLEYLNGYKIIITKNVKSSRSCIKKSKELWFVNLGGSSSNSIIEKHEIFILVASSKKEAKAIAKTKASKTIKNLHFDNILKINDNINNNNADDFIFKIVLENDTLSRSHNLIPDWQGYSKLYS